MKSLNQLSNESLSVCDGCSNWRICKFGEDVKRAEAEYKQLRENASWPECVEKTLGCKYKQRVTNWRSAEIPTDQKYMWNGEMYVTTGDPPFIYNGDTACNTTG